MITQIKNKYKSDDISVCILGSVKEYREATKLPVSFSKVSHYKLLDLQIDAIRNVFPKSQIYFTVPDLKKKLYKQIYGNINIIQNYTHDGHGLEIKLCLEEIQSRRALFIDSSVIFDEYTLIQMVGKKSCTIVNQKMQKNRQDISTSGSSILNHISYGLPHKWSKMLLLDERELHILKKLNIKNYNKLEFYEIVNAIIENGGKINSIRHSRGLLGHIIKDNICVF